MNMISVEKLNKLKEFADHYVLLFGEWLLKSEQELSEKFENCCSQLSFKDLACEILRLTCCIFDEQVILLLYVDSVCVFTCFPILKIAFSIE